MREHRLLEGNINPVKINVNNYIGMKISELTAIIPHDYRIRILTEGQRSSEQIVHVSGSNTLNIVVDDQRQRVVKVLGYYN